MKELAEEFYNIIEKIDLSELDSSEDQYIHMMLGKLELMIKLDLYDIETMKEAINLIASKGEYLDI